MNFAHFITLKNQYPGGTTHSSAGATCPAESAPGMTTPHVNLIHGRTRVRLPMRATVGELRRDIHAATGVAPEAQRCITGGKKIVADDGEAVAAVGVRDGGTVMLTVARVPGKRAGGQMVAKGALEEVRALRGEAAASEVACGAARDLLARRVQGFLGGAMLEEAIGRSEREVRGVMEACMAVVERLDAVVVAGDEQARAERKAAVLFAQGVLRACDGLCEDIATYRKDEFDEVKSRRGKE